MLIDHEALSGMVNMCSVPGARIALVGFNEYAKHLLNLCGNNIVTIYDEDASKIGIRFRGKSVAPASERHEITQIVACEYTALYPFLGTIDDLYDRSVPIYYPPRLHYKSAEDVKVFDQDPIYRRIKGRTSLAPTSMMENDKIWFALELIRQALNNPGNIIEMGVYQAGSAWYMAQLLSELKEARHIYLMDVFEQHVMHPNATMCTDEIRVKLAFYPHTTLLEGLVDDPKLLDRIKDETFCFAHYDLGVHFSALEFLWDHLATGAPLLLDNYGHLAAHPWVYDRFFRERAAHVIRLPWSEQGLVFKR